MDLESIISITGKPGLFKVLSQTKNGLIVESVVDKKRMPVYSSEKVSALDDISVYTYEGDIPLKEVYEKVYDKTGGERAIDHKSDPEELRSFLQEVVSDFDQDRVYNSDLKKLFLWFNILVDKGLIKKKTDKDAKTTKKTPKKVKKAVATNKQKNPKASPKTSGAKGGSKTSAPLKKG